MFNRTNEQQSAPMNLASPATITAIPNIAAAGLASSFSYLVFHPPSTAVNRTQMHEGRITTMDELKRIIFLDAHDKNIGRKIQSMYKGFLSAMTYKLLSRTMKYTTQPVIAQKIVEQGGELAIEKFGNIHGKALIHAIAGGTVGAIEVTLLHPLNTFKTRRQAYDLRPLMQIYRTESGYAFYNGFGMAFAKSIPAAFALFGTNAGVMSYYAINNSEDASLKHRFVAAASGVIVGAMVTNPQDIVMKRAQALHKSVSSLSLFKQIVTQEGLKGLYRGIVLNIATSLPKKAAPLALYGYFANHWQQSKKEEISERKPTEYLRAT